MGAKVPRILLKDYHSWWTQTHTHGPPPFLSVSEKPLKHLTFHRTSSAAVVSLAFHPLAPDSPNKQALCLWTRALLLCQSTIVPFCECVCVCVFVLAFGYTESILKSFLFWNKGSAEARSSDSQRRGDSYDGDRWNIGSGDRRAGCRPRKPQGQ